nr:importin subunit alpha-1-like [Parasteatoda tepidariorum]
MVLPTLAELINHSDQEVLADSLDAISCLTEGSNMELQEVINANVLPRLCELLEMREYSIISPALNAVGHIISVDDEQTQTAINAGALQALKVLLSHPMSRIVEVSDKLLIVVIPVAECFPTFCKRQNSLALISFCNVHLIITKMYVTN